MLRPCHLHGESKGSERRTLLVDIIDSADAVFRAGDRNFLLAPCALEVTCLHRVADGQPAWSLDLLLKNEQLKHTLLRAEDSFEGVASQVGG